MKKGNINSIETMGLVDGPGIRVVIFMQGCPLRCSFCHNPETWNFTENTLYTAEELMQKILKFKPYFDKSNGGVTFSGGEPLMQGEFLLEILKLCKENNIHTCIDTSGYYTILIDEILELVDLVIYDIKHLNSIKYKELTSKDINTTNIFYDKLVNNNNKIWIRQVIIPKYNDTIEYINSIYEYIKDNKNIEKIELLPYKKFGIEKYKSLNIEYALSKTEEMDYNWCIKYSEYLQTKYDKNKEESYGH